MADKLVAQFTTPKYAHLKNAFLEVDTSDHTASSEEKVTTPPISAELLARKDAQRRGKLYQQSPMALFRSPSQRNGFTTVNGPIGSNRDEPQAGGGLTKSAPPTRPTSAVSRSSRPSSASGTRRDLSPAATVASRPTLVVSLGNRSPASSKDTKRPGSAKVLSTNVAFKGATLPRPASSRAIAHVGIARAAARAGWMDDEDDENEKPSIVNTLALTAPPAPTAKLPMSGRSGTIMKRPMSGTASSTTFAGTRPLLTPTATSQTPTLGPARRLSLTGLDQPVPDDPPQHGFPSYARHTKSSVSLQYVSRRPPWEGNTCSSCHHKNTVHDCKTAMTKHVKKNMKVAGEYRPRPTMRRRTLPSGAVIAYSAEVDQEQVLAMLAEKTAEANRRISMRLSAMIAFSSLPRFRVVNFPELLGYARQLTGQGNNSSQLSMTAQSRRRKNASLDSTTEGGHSSSIGDGLNTVSTSSVLGGWKPVMVSRDIFIRVLNVAGFIGDPVLLILQALYSSLDIHAMDSVSFTKFVRQCQKLQDALKGISDKLEGALLALKESTTSSRPVSRPPSPRSSSPPKSIHAMRFMSPPASAKPSAPASAMTTPVLHLPAPVPAVELNTPQTPNTGTTLLTRRLSFLAMVEAHRGAAQQAEEAKKQASQDGEDAVAKLFMTEQFGIP